MTQEEFKRIAKAEKILGRIEKKLNSMAIKIGALFVLLCILLSLLRT
jgi:hypothetical protein